MKSTPRYLNDEHMRLYEWNGLRSGAALSPAQESKRSRAWHASAGVLAVLTTLLLLNGCDNTTTAEQQATEPVDQTAQAPSDRPFYDEAPGMGTGEAAAPSAPAAETAPGTDPMGTQTPPSGETGSPAGGTTQP